MVEEQTPPMGELQQHFDKLLGLEWPRLKRVALLLTKGNYARADDLLSDTLRRAWSGFPRLDDEECFRGWINSALSSSFRDSRRVASRDKDRFTSLDAIIDVYDDHFQPLTAIADPLAEVIRAEEWQYWLGSLPGDLQELFYLHYRDELSLTEIAERFDRPVSTISTRLYRARRLIMKNYTRRFAHFASLSQGSVE